MADIAAVAPTAAGVVTTPTASTPGGDTITGVASTNDFLLNIFNGHASSITVNIAGTAQTRTLAGLGACSVTPAAIAVAVAAGAYKSILIPASQIAGYINGDSEIPITYTSGNAALTVQPLKL